MLKTYKTTSCILLDLSFYNMATYKVTELSFIKDRMYKPGELVEYDGEPSYNLEPVVTNDKKRIKKLEYKNESRDDLEIPQGD